VVVRRSIATLTGFFEVGSRKRRVLVVVFCGEFVVLCMADVVVEQPYLELQKMRHRFRLFLFFVRCQVCSLIILFDLSTFAPSDEVDLACAGKMWRRLRN
jgi:hypothetical protein